MTAAAGIPSSSFGGRAGEGNQESLAWAKRVSQRGAIEPCSATVEARAFGSRAHPASVDDRVCDARGDLPRERRGVVIRVDIKRIRSSALHVGEPQQFIQL